MNPYHTLAVVPYIPEAVVALYRQVPALPPLGMALLIVGTLPASAVGGHLELLLDDGSVVVVTEQLHGPGGGAGGLAAVAVVLEAQHELGVEGGGVAVAGALAQVGDGVQVPALVALLRGEREVEACVLLVREHQLGVARLALGSCTCKQEVGVSTRCSFQFFQLKQKDFFNF